MDMPFFNREEELDFLNKKFQSGRAELLIFRGRRRVGKTVLLKEFSRQVNGLYLLASVTSVQDQLQIFSPIISRYFEDAFLSQRPFAAWDELFIYLQQRVQQRTAIIIDEYPYLLEAQPGLGTILQKHWDESFHANPNIFLVLNGSALSMMEKETLASKAPLYGRRTGQWFVDPFDPVENNKFFVNTSLIRAIEWYALTGGIPFYAQIFARHATPLEAILQEVLTYGEVLFEEVEFILRGEFRNPRSYFPILKAIATGSQKFGEISSKTGYDRANLTKYLSALESLKLIHRETPITEKNPAKSKKGIYHLSDYFMHLWFNYVFPHLTELQTEGREQVMEKIVRPSFDRFVSRVCERIIRQLLQQNFFGLNMAFDRLGRHWDSQTEIDVFGYTKDGNTAIGEIKWTASPVGMEVLQSLDKKIAGMRPHLQGQIQKLILSKSGFAKEATGHAGEFLLIDLSTYKL